MGDWRSDGVKNINEMEMRRVQHDMLLELDRMQKTGREFRNGSQIPYEL